MNAAELDLDALLKRLHLPPVRRLYAPNATRAAEEGWSHRDFLALPIAEEVAHQPDTRIEKAARRAHFPFIKTIESFAFVFQSSVRRHQPGLSLGPEPVSEGRNLILAGRPGRGRTHLAEVILDRVLERGQQIKLGGRSWRTRHIGPGSFGDEDADPETVRKVGPVEEGSED